MSGLMKPKGRVDGRTSTFTPLSMFATLSPTVLLNHTGIACQTCEGEKLLKSKASFGNMAPGKQIATF